MKALVGVSIRPSEPDGRCGAVSRKFAGWFVASSLILHVACGINNGETRYKTPVDQTWLAANAYALDKCNLGMNNSASDRALYEIATAASRGDDVSLAVPHLIKYTNSCGDSTTRSIAARAVLNMAELGLDLNQFLPLIISEAGEAAPHPLGEEMLKAGVALLKNPKTRARAFDTIEGILSIPVNERDRFRAIEMVGRAFDNGVEIQPLIPALVIVAKNNSDICNRKASKILSKLSLKSR